MNECTIADHEEASYHTYTSRIITNNYQKDQAVWSLWTPEVGSTSNL